MPTPEVKPAPLRDTNYQNKIIELIDFNKKKNRYNHDPQSSNAVDLPPRIRYNLQLVMSVRFSSYFPFRQPAANSAGVW